MATARFFLIAPQKLFFPKEKSLSNLGRAPAIKENPWNWNIHSNIRKKRLNGGQSVVVITVLRDHTKFSSTLHSYIRTRMRIDRLMKNN